MGGLRHRSRRRSAAGRGDHRPHRRGRSNGSTNETTSMASSCSCRCRRTFMCSMSSRRSPPPRTSTASRRPASAGFILGCRRSIRALRWPVWRSSTTTRFRSPATRAVVVGRGNVVGKPMAALLTARDATVTLCHSRTCAARRRDQDRRHRRPGGRPPGLAPGGMIKPGATVIDFGVNVAAGRIIGDADAESVERSPARTPRCPAARRRSRLWRWPATRSRRPTRRSPRLESATTAKA